MEWRIWYTQFDEKGAVIGRGVYYKSYKRKGYAERVAKRRYSGVLFRWTVSQTNPYSLKYVC